MAGNKFCLRSDDLLQILVRRNGHALERG
jgi:hypothetical protein